MLRAEGSQGTVKKEDGALVIIGRNPDILQRRVILA